MTSHIYGRNTIAILKVNTVVLCVVKWRRFIALFEWNWIRWFKKMSTQALSYKESDVRVRNICRAWPTTWRKNGWHRYDM